ncbi:hypothetical protein BDD12DRAFT_914573 [Trichophaea hybrida]|nr:hypothetical protein BDD12DRAFT_914573 [Trichophaea hybrida]
MAKSEAAIRMVLAAIAISQGGAGSAAINTFTIQPKRLPVFKGEWNMQVVGDFIRDLQRQFEARCHQIGWLETITPVGSGTTTPTTGTMAAGVATPRTDGCTSTTVIDLHSNHLTTQPSRQPTHPLRHRQPSSDACLHYGHIQPPLMAPKGIALPRLQRHLDNATPEEPEASPVLRDIKKLVCTGSYKATRELNGSSVDLATVLTVFKLVYAKDNTGAVKPKHLWGIKQFESTSPWLYRSSVYVLVIAAN